LQAVLATAKTIGEMRRDEAAEVAWEAVYPTLTTDHPGMAGTMIARAEAQVVRLSMIYALLDKTATIRHEHLTAALAVWQYCEASVRYLFGSTLGDTRADTLLAALQDCAPKGLSRKEVTHGIFQRNLRADELDRLLRLLLDRQLIRIAHGARQTGYGRGKELYYACENDLYDLYDPSTVDYVSLSNDAVKTMELRSYHAAHGYDLSSTAPAPMWCPTCQTDYAVTLHGRQYHCVACGEMAGYVPDDDAGEAAL
jgi:hypothetical protein